MTRALALLTLALLAACGADGDPLAPGGAAAMTATGTITVGVSS